MADCVSLPNAAELVGELRAWSGCIIYGENCDECGKEEGQERRFCRRQQETMFIAADAIEQLMHENAKLKAERDAAVEDFTDLNKRYGAYCRYCKGSKCGFKTEDGWCVACPNWEWRGVQDG